jgi:hypothetical protein
MQLLMCVLQIPDISTISEVACLTIFFFYFVFCLLWNHNVSEMAQGWDQLYGGAQQNKDFFLLGNLKMVIEPISEMLWC